MRRVVNGEPRNLVGVLFGTGKTHTLDHTKPISLKINENYFDGVLRCGDGLSREQLVFCTTNLQLHQVDPYMT